MKKINLTSQGQKINGALFIPDNGKKNPGVIFFHGAGSNENRYIPMAEKLLEKDIAALIVHMPYGEGGNFDRVTVKNSLLDAIAAYDFFISQNGIDSTRIGICGSSYGGALAANLTEYRLIKSLFLRAPAAYTDEMEMVPMKTIMHDEEKFFKLLDVKNTSAIKAMAKFKGNLFVLISEKDEIIPSLIPEAYLKMAKLSERKESFIMKKAVHGPLTPEHQEQFINIMTKWFVETL